jgi:UDP-N-acetylmuramoylalanine--D-glutamate ligase
MRVLILGAAVSGKAAAELALRLGHTVTIFDEKPSEQTDLAVGLVSGRWDRELLGGVDLVVTSPGFSERSLPIVESLEEGLPVWSEVEFAWRQAKAPVLAVTGTNGKTTVTRAATEMLARSNISAVAAGNIGTPLSQVVGLGHEVLVVEVSSFQLRFTETFHPHTAVLINVAADHLDWHGSTYSYQAAKAKVFANQTDSDLLIFDADDPGASRLVAKAPPAKHPVSLTHLPIGGSGISNDRLNLLGTTLDLAGLPIDNPALMVDLVAAGVAAIDRGASIESVVQVMRTFEVPMHRRTVVAKVAGVRYVDDSKATNPHAALAAIASYPSVVLIAGGLAKGLDTLPLAAAPNLRHLVGIGTAGKDLVRAAGPGKGTLAASMKEAVEVATNHARSGDVVLLAPGCASFDMYTDYAARGEAFADAIRFLPQERSDVGGGGEERSDEPEGARPEPGGQEGAKPEKGTTSR